MKLIFVILSSILLLGVVGWISFQKIGDVRPAILPPSASLANQFESSAVPSSSASGQMVALPLKSISGTKVGLFAKDLGKARGMAFSPGGVLLVSDMGGQGKIYALPDKNGDGVADSRQEVVSGLNNTHGLAFFGGKLFITEKTKVSRYNWDEKTLKATLDKKLFDLPDPGGHFTRTIKFDQKGTMYISLGSSCNVCVEKEPFFASVIVSDAEGKKPEVFAKGLRNSVALAIEPTTEELWSADNGRDLLGDDIPPEEVNILKQGGDYGWPICYGDKIHDINFDKKQYSVDPCQNTEAPVFGMPSHNAPLGMAFVPESFKSEWKDDLVVALHGSWNRSTPDGYKVVRLNREGDKIVGMEDLLSGFIQGSNAQGRPVDVIFDEKGNLYVSDDKAGNIYIVNRM